jgi:hypothetical protein
MFTTAADVMLENLRQAGVEVRRRRTTIFWVTTLCLAITMPAQPAADVPEVEGSFHGFPVLRDLDGSKLANGEFLQRIEGGRVHIRNTYEFSRDHRVDESAVFRLEPFSQEEWTWREVAGGILLREYSVDLRTGHARAQKKEKHETKQWNETLDIESGRTFAGVGFTTAIKRLRPRLLQGETVELRAVGFTPKPRLVTVKVSRVGIDRMSMAGREVLGERFTVDAKIPAIAKIIIDVPETRIWLTHPPPAGFLRWEGPFAEPTDAVVRVDLLPGDPSGLAEPVSSSAANVGAARGR